MLQSERSVGLGMLALLALAAAASAEVLDFHITLDGNQEVPPVDTAATGMGTVQLDTDTNELTWNITFSGLSSPEAAAHFHGPAPLCTVGGVMIGLEPGSPKVGSTTLTDQQKIDLMGGLWYVNIHTELHGSGELRGQVVPSALENPLVDTIATGALHILLETVATELTAPNWGTSASGRDELFVTDQHGILWAIDRATGSKRVFLDVRPLLVDLGVFGPGTFDERGLLGVAFHPQFADNGLLYTYTSEAVFKPADFSTMPPGVLPNHRAVIRAWRVPDPAASDAIVDPTTSRVLLRIDEPQFNHNAGGLAFGPDGMLYIALGDGGGADDKDGQISLGAPIVGHGCGGNGQNAETILGSMLRIDPDGSDSANGQYGIPPDNPFVDEDDVRLDEIFAYGFRNPFRFSFDSLTGELFVGDVGQGDIEEIDIVVSGGNYGWNRKEGTFTFIANGDGPGYVTDRPQVGPPDLIDPIAEYDHDDGISIIGGFVYRGTRIAPLVGRYVFGEFAVTFDNDGRLLFLDERNQIREFELVDRDAVGLSVLGFGQDADGELYVMANATGVPFEETGVVLRITTRIADFDADGVVGFSDLLALLGAWGPCDACPQDIDMSGAVGLTDLLTVLANWG